MEFLKLVSQDEKMIIYRDQEIKTTWKISLNAKRFYRKSDPLYATQDIKFDDGLSINEAKELLFEKAEKYRNRVLKNGGWNIPASNCYPKSFISL